MCTTLFFSLQMLFFLCTVYRFNHIKRKIPRNTKQTVFITHTSWQLCDTNLESMKLERQMCVSMVLVLPPHPTCSKSAACHSSPRVTLSSPCPSDLLTSCLPATSACGGHERQPGGEPHRPVHLCHRHERQPARVQEPGLQRLGGRGLQARYQ